MLKKDIKICSKQYYNQNGQKDIWFKLLIMKWNSIIFNERRMSIHWEGEEKSDTEGEFKFASE